VIASVPPETVTVLSVEFGSISVATWIEALLFSLNSLILKPPFPIRDPQIEAGTIILKVLGALPTNLTPGKEF
jgi:hypothetical protein